MESKKGLILFFLIVLAIGLYQLLGPNIVKDDRIRLIAWGITEGECRVGYQAMLDEFERRNPHIRIVATPVGRGTSSEKLMAAVAGNSPPDIILQDRNLIGNWAGRGAFMALDSLIANDPDTSVLKIREENYYASCWHECNYQGKIYGVPSITNVSAFFWNKKMFSQAGLDPDAPPKNWDELQTMAARLHKFNEAGKIVELGFLPYLHGAGDPLTLYCWQNGGEILSKDGRTCLFNSPQNLEALKYMVGYYDRLGGAEVVGAFRSSIATEEALGAFFRDLVAMEVDDDWALYRLARHKPDMDFGIAPMPAPQNGTSYTWSGGLAYAIPTGAKHVQEAWELIKWVVSREANLIKNKAWADFARSKGRQFYPGLHSNKIVNAAVVDSFGFKNEKFASAQRLLVDLMPTAKSYTQSVIMSLLKDEQRRCLEKAFYGIYSPEESIKRSSEIIQKELDRVWTREVHNPVNWKKIFLIISSIFLVGFIIYLGFLFKDKRQNQSNEGFWGLFFASPWLVGFTVFTAGPFLFSIILSFCEYDVLHPAYFVGFKNFSYLFKNDPIFWKSLYNTIFMVLGVPLNIVVSLSIALLLNANIKRIAFYRTIYYLPSIVPIVAGSVLWLWVLNPDFGIVNVVWKATLTRWWELEAPLWIRSESWSKPSILLMGLWGAGGSMLIWLAGLKDIPQTLYEAAKIDGAGKWKQFVNITIPMLSPYIFFNTIMGVIGTFKIFAQAYVMTEGGPVDSTLFYVYYIFNNAFRYFRMGYASALAWILFIIIVVITVFQFIIAPRWVHYQRN